MIYLTATQLQQIRLHAQTTYPQECCGLLLGTLENQHKFVLEVRETENNWSSQTDESLPHLPSSTGQPLSKNNRFSIAPEILLQVQKEVRDRQINLIGIYHSHPDYLAIPSEFDRVIAWPEYSYLIVSVVLGKATELKSWTVNEHQQFQSEIIKYVA
ncbi:M67 family metallopeptidase [Crocosphaera sp. UHCC 0190]|uniref:M67 family metallopeptidase n=1 Tax=Crocosphaera sp. UHCC 0190 TaxID=3110246 RepID=UPI002B213248|nr:M67 family metallopeptidase [Crocosphaera sp. UHCC 0190]MEA5511856.1 M67 family metallopeptidase [Crocosphaera sp. UHCC 0190]